MKCIPVQQPSLFVDYYLIAQLGFYASWLELGRRCVLSLPGPMPSWLAKVIFSPLLTVSVAGLDAHCVIMFVV